MARIKDLTSKTKLANDDYLVVDSESAGTKNILYQDTIRNMLYGIEGADAGLHNSIYRGKDLTNIYSVTEICDRIATGTFNDLWIGDYFTVSMTTEFGTENVSCVLAGFDQYLRSGDASLSLNKHHAVVVPLNPFKTATVINDTDTTEGGYANSKMRTITLPIYSAALQTIFENRIITHKELLSNSVSTTIPSAGRPGWNGASNNWDWFDSILELMSEPEVYGAVVFSSSAYDIGIAKVQLPLFRLKPDLVNPLNRWGYWLKSVVSATHFANAGSYGRAYYYTTSYTGGVRPRFLIG